MPVPRLWGILSRSPRRIGSSGPFPEDKQPPLAVSSAVNPLGCCQTLSRSKLEMVATHRCKGSEGDSFKTNSRGETGFICCGEEKHSSWGTWKTNRFLFLCRLWRIRAHFVCVCVCICLPNGGPLHAPDEVDLS